MAAPTRTAAALKLDWAGISSSLGLRGATASSLLAFKKRNEDARRRVAQLSAQPTPADVDFAHYRATLKNAAVVDAVEREVRAWRPKTYDVERQVRAIEKFEVQGVKQAEATKGRVEEELSDLKRTLGNIEGARAVEDLTVDDIVKARPDIDEKVARLVSKGRWDVPGYKEKFGDLSVL